MYSGIKQSTMAKSLLMSESKYNRKENGLSEIKLQEAIKMAKLLDLNEKIIEEFWLADKIYELMKLDKEQFYEAVKIVELNFDNYEHCVDVPSKNCSFSSLEERLQHRKKK
ncbi:MAG: helix-turn-helix transcriptional regulator [Bacteroidales bacterium]|nr:helix-turn-helix transcriptional regulator [Bacteroidales bacterium]